MTAPDLFSLKPTVRTFPEVEGSRQRRAPEMMADLNRACDACLKDKGVDNAE